MTSSPDPLYQRAREAERVMRNVAAMLKPVADEVRTVARRAAPHLHEHADVIEEAIRALTFTPTAPASDGEENGQ